MNKYGLIGNPVKHSLSPKIYEIFAQQVGIPFDYTEILSRKDTFISDVKCFQEAGGLGLNVTLPFKHDAFCLSDEFNAESIESRAASVLKFHTNGAIEAINYDGIAFLQDLKKNHGIVLSDKKVLILGAGGAAQGILAPLLRAEPQVVVIANRNLEKVSQLSKSYAQYQNVSVLGFHELASDTYDLVLHATSVGHTGTFPQDLLPHGTITSHSICYDISYGEVARSFLEFSRSQGCELCLDGLGMLIEHNALAFHLWLGYSPDTMSVIQLFKE